MFQGLTNINNYLLFISVDESLLIALTEIPTADESLLTPLTKKSTEKHEVASTDIEFYRNRRNTMYLKYKNEVYAKHRERDNRIDWRCMFFNKHCHARIVTIGSKISKIGGTHNHSPPNFKKLKKNLIRINGEPEI